MAAVAEFPGFADEGFGPVADAFVENFRRGDEMGAACAVYHRGRLVVDLYGGTADAVTGRPWSADTLTIGFSVSKGLMALCGYLAHQRGLLDFDTPVAALWPRFAANGKQDITIREVFAHRAGLMALDVDLTLDDVLAWEPVIRAIEAQRPLWAPGTAFAYHALTFGWLTGEILRRATGRMPGALLAEYLTDDLGVDAWIGLPGALQHRVARMHAPRSRLLRGSYRALPKVLRRIGKAPAVRTVTLGSAFPFSLIDGCAGDFNTPAVHAAQIPAANGILDARALAAIYGAAVSPVLGAPLLTPASLADAVTVRSAGDGWSSALNAPGIRFSTGFLINGIPFRPLLSDSSFGHDGVSGSLGFADADSQTGFGYVNNLIAPRDHRANDLTAALRRCLDR
ncbi:esterase [Mycobacterium antarcticum]|uniref:serine hydrolase domain-containing protein n=1 Tax=unclassified Mycolicibacterium TaxID=2636767 RepID=UPI0023A47B7A|nr:MULTISPECIES: serine hydrolase domain-containing protein [unclassified Mycolicibacterium]BDX30151.1 esterase [Mycolicibacterium sp. TUM20985]GLP73609.1 esterase [Mycolicibacterium sp. TUM20983]